MGRPLMQIVICTCFMDLEGGRDMDFAAEYTAELPNGLFGCRLTTDGHKAYLETVKDTFGSEVDYESSTPSHVSKDDIAQLLASKS